MMIGFVILAVCMVSPPKDSDVVKDVDNGVQLIGKGKANFIMPDISTLSKPKQKEGNTADNASTKTKPASWFATHQWAYPIEIGTAMM
uniref:Inorganic phosphate cotransporter n=1 Tax=Panagrellus redivivus TaxID=6233 RepID=A0A7E4VFC7_PANRE